MPQKLWPLLLILISSFVAGCNGTLPVRPHADICMVSAPAPTPEEPAPFQGCLCSDGVKNWRLTFAECDKYVAIEPRQFEAVTEYLLELEKMAQKGCGLKSAPASEFLKDFYPAYQLLETRLK